MAAVLTMAAAVTPSATYAAVCATATAAAAAAAAAVSGCNGFRQTDLQTH